MHEFEWELYKEKLRARYSLTEYNLTVAVEYQGKLIGGCREFRAWAAENFDYTETPSASTCEVMAEREYHVMIKDEDKRFCFLIVKVGESAAKRIVFELDYANCQRTCDNFISLVEGSQLNADGTRMCYKGSKIHRVVPNGYFEGGLIKSRKGGSTNESVYGGFFPDENYIVRHSRVGVLGMSKPGPHKNGSVFYVTLDKLPHFNRKYVAFGRVVEGLDVLRTIWSVECSYQRPVPDIYIEECSVISEVTVKRIETPHETEEQEEEKTRPVSHEKNEIRKSKLENADIETLMKKRDAVIKYIDKTKAELDS